MKKVREEVEAVDVTNNEMMIQEGLRQPNRVPRDPSVWSKTEKERRLWRKYRRVAIPNQSWTAPEKTGGLPGKLIIQVRGLGKTTYAYKCLTTDVRYLLSKYKTNYSSIVKSSWNGKTFDPECVRLWRA